MLPKTKSIIGFTLIELLVVIAITAIIGATTIPIGSAFMVRNFLNNKTDELVSSLRTAQKKSMNGKEDKEWGVEVSASQIKMFATGDSSFDQTFSIPSSISITQDTVTFNQLSGNPDATATYVLSSNTGDTYSVSINAVGAIDIN